PWWRRCRERRGARGGGGRGRRRWGSIRGWRGGWPTAWGAGGGGGGRGGGGARARRRRGGGGAGGGGSSVGDVVRTEPDGGVALAVRARRAGGLRGRRGGARGRPGGAGADGAAGVPAQS